MTGWLQGATPHLLVVPVLLPLFTAALMLLLGERRRRWKAMLNVGSTALGLLVAVGVLRYVDGQSSPAAMAAMGVYLPGNWDVPHGIVLSADRLSALMLVLASTLGLASVLFAVSRWDRAGVHFHPLFQIQLMGLNGAFLTSDLFNLFVFFEVMLAASYGLLLHGSGRFRVLSGLHYIALNLLASSLFLIGAALVYGVTGTLNFADIADRIASLGDSDRALLHVAAALLAVVFLIKAAAWPLDFWLPPAYAAASAPVAALFAIMTKVGVYALLRLQSLMFSSAAGPSAGFGGELLVVAGLLTLGFGATGMLASRPLNRMAGYAAIVSAGTVMAAVGFGQPRVTGGALYYLFASTLAIGALFLMVELIDRSRQAQPGASAVKPGDLPVPLEPLVPRREKRPLGRGAPLVAGSSEGRALPAAAVDEGVNLDDDERALIGRVIPAAMAFLGLGFVLSALLVAGLPPLSGFIGKVGMVQALLDPQGFGSAYTAPSLGSAAGVLIALLFVSGLMSLVALSRAGIQMFWSPQERPAPSLRVIECVPVAGLLVVCLALSVHAEPAMRYARDAAAALSDPRGYIAAVKSARPVAPASSPSPLSSSSPSLTATRASAVGPSTVPAAVTETVR